jgi:MFS family permease
MPGAALHPHSLPPSESSAGLLGRSRRGVGRTFQALRNPNYRLFWLGQLVSQSGTWMQRVAQAWLVLTLTDSPLALGTVTTLQFLPILLLSLFGGVLADRVPKRRLLLVTQSVAAAQSLVLAALTATGQIQLWQIYCLAAVLGLANALDNPTRQAFVVELVGREDLPNAVALNSTLFNTSRLVGPALGGLAVATIGFSGAFFLNTASFLAVIVGLALMRPERFHQVPTPVRGPVFRRVGEGLAYAFRTPEVLFVLIVLGALGTFGYNFNVALPLLARFVLTAGPTGLGALTSAIGFGALLAALWQAYGRRTSRRVMISSASVFSVFLFLTGLSQWFLATLALLVVLGFASIVFTTAANTRLQLVAPDHLRGRVMSLYTLLFAGTTPIGSLFIGGSAERWGVPFALILAALLCGLGVLAGLAYLRRRSFPTGMVLEQSGPA